MDTEIELQGRRISAAEMARLVGWGEEAFRKELLAHVEEKRGASHYGEELPESAVQKAEWLVRDGLAKLGWTEPELAARKNGDESKLKLAVKLQAETTTCLPAGR